MRVLCLDVGERRIGVAVTDALDLTAQGVETIQVASFEKNLDRIRELCAYYQTDRILCGLPRNMDGSEGFQAQRVRDFASKLVDNGLQVRFQDERMTTKLATGVLLQADIRRNRRKDFVDKLAATYILQSFMDAGGWKDEIIKKPFIGGIYRMSNKDMEKEMLNNEVDDERIFQLMDDEGNEVNFVFQMSFEYNKKTYICFSPAEPMEDMDEDECILVRVELDKDGEEIFVTVTDEEELAGAYAEYVSIVESEE